MIELPRSYFFFSSRLPPRFVGFAANYYQETDKKKIISGTQVNIFYRDLLACVAGVSVWFHSKERQKNGIISFGLALAFSFTSVIFARSLNLVPRSLLRNHTKTLATQARDLQRP